jgi:hypothetical protein
MRGSILIFGLSGCGGVGLPTSACFGGVEGCLGVLSAIAQFLCDKEEISPDPLLEFNLGVFIYLI